jgi:AcrR family transcriptional regulator
MCYPRSPPGLPMGISKVARIIPRKKRGSITVGLTERRIREKEDRRCAILNAARKLFFEKGFKPVTVDSIAKKAELSKGSIYLHFDSKEEIYTRILLNDIEQFQNKTVGFFHDEKSAADILKEFADIYVDFFLNDREMFRILMTFMVHMDRMKLSQDVESHVIRATNRTISIIDEILQYGIGLGDFPADMHVRQTRNAIWGLLNGVISLHFSVGEESNREERIRSTVKLGLESFIKGLIVGKAKNEANKSEDK